jgi:hypothetical protein
MVDGAVAAAQAEAFAQVARRGGVATPGAVMLLATGAWCSAWVVSL